MCLAGVSPVCTTMGVVAVTEETQLPDAVDELHSAVAGLIDQAKELVNGRILAGPSQYEILLSEIPATRGEQGSRGVATSVAPAWADAIDLQATIDRRVKSWIPEGDSTPARLRVLASRRWRPQDVRAVRDIAAEVSSWTVSIKALVEPAHVKTVAAPCPNCNQRWYYRNHSGEQVRNPALQIVAEVGCSCQCCRAFWPPTQYLFLVRLLGFEMPAGVVA